MKILTLFSTIALAAALSLSACKKDKKEDKPADTPATDMAKTTEGTAADTPAEPTPPPAETAPPPAEPAAPARPASITDDHVKTADEFVSAVAAAATAAEGAKTDCKTMAKALGEQAKVMKALVAKLDAMKTANEKDVAAKEWFKATYEVKVMDAFNKLLTAIEPCKTDKGVMTALKDIGPKKKEAAPTPAK
ncbi:MAG TPA: hypothetical protein VFU21_11545 [Kofleriaceae bacterium]|nr:hypothetical protein [Kofleriaceae bacterium]